MRAATFIAVPASNIVSNEVADQWKGVTIPIDNSTRSPATVETFSDAAILFLGLSLLEDIAKCEMPPTDIARKHAALEEWLAFSRKAGMQLFFFKPRQNNLPLEEFVRIREMAV
jgi:hypothetical protein